MHNYVCVYDMFPNCGNNAQDDYSPLARLLPYCEQENLENLIDFRIKMGIDGTDLPVVLRPAAKTVVPLFLCPSDSEKAAHDVQGVSEAIVYAGSNYAINGGSGGGSSDGICHRGGTQRRRDVTDGMTNTLAFTETLRGPCGDPPPLRPTPDSQIYRGQLVSGVAMSVVLSTQTMLS